MTTNPADAILADDPPRRRGVALLWQQTVALTLDAYRQLQARKLFWITLVLSTLVAASFAFITINAGGLKILWFRTLEIPGFNTTVLSPAAFYKLAFTTLGIHVWLAWAAVILALISTAGMIPELISDGSIDLYLSKPIGRTRLILTKYVLGLLFVALQTFCFCVAAFFVIGFRGGAWLPSLFWAVPILSLFYSFIYSIAAVVGLLTGSTVAAILVTLLVWLLVFAVDQVDAGLLQAESVQELMVERYQGSIDFDEKMLSRLPTPAVDPATTPATNPATNPSTKPARNILQETYANGLDESTRQHERAAASLASLRDAHWWVYLIKAPLPKTAETVGVLDRVLLPEKEMEKSEEARNEGFTSRINNEDRRERQRTNMEASNRAIYAYRDRSLWWSLGTSALFEVVLLGFACWRFGRRDF